MSRELKIKDRVKILADPSLFGGMVGTITGVQGDLYLVSIRTGSHGKYPKECLEYMPPLEPKKEHLSIRLDKDVKEYLKNIAAARRSTVSEVVKSVLVQFFYSDKDEKTEALKCLLKIK